MLKVFTTSLDANNAGDELTRLFEEWKDSLSYNIKVKKIHSNSNQNGWMLSIIYESDISGEKWCTRDWVSRVSSGLPAGGVDFPVYGHNG